MNWIGCGYDKLRSTVELPRPGKILGILPSEFVIARVGVFVGDDMADISEKQCRRCERVLPVSEFYPCYSMRTGYVPYCKPCNAEKRRLWRDKNRSHANAQQLAYNRKNAKLRKQWTATNRARFRVELREASRIYRQNHLAEHAESEGRRRARKRGSASLAATPELTAIYLVAHSSGILPCEYCGHPTGPRERHVDHRTPLSRGGQHTPENLSIACISCNLSKASQTAEEFLVGGVK